MEVLVLDGKNYVKASKAARDLGYATDYVGQLCRSGQVDAHLIGRTWYVDVEQLSSHRFEKKRMSRVKAREQAKKTIEEHRKKSAQAAPKERSVPIRYESDTEDLIPETRKISVASQTYAYTGGVESETIVENKGSKVQMSGNLEVVDVTDGPVETDTIFLTPTKFKKGTTGEKKLKEIEVTPEEIPVEMESKTSNFIQKLAANQVITEEGVEDDSTVALDTANDGNFSKGDTAQSRASFIWYMFLCLLIFILSMLTIPVSTNTNYSSVYPDGFDSSYSFSIPEAIAILKLRI